MVEPEAFGFEPKENAETATFSAGLDDAANKALYKLYEADIEASKIGTSVKVEPKARYRRAGAVQIALERGFKIRCRFVRRAVEDIQTAILDEAFVQSWLGRDRFLYSAHLIQRRLKSLAEGHGKDCPSECRVRM